MKHLVYLVVFVSLIMSVEPRIGLAQGDSNLNNTVVKKATKEVETSAKNTAEKVKETTTNGIANAQNSDTTKTEKSNSTVIKPKPKQKKSTPTPNPKTNFKNAAVKPKAVHKIKVVTQNPDIEVYIDDELVGKTNQKSELVKEVEEGTYNISAKYGEDDLVEKTVNIEKSQTVYLTKDDRNNIDESETDSTISTLKIEETKVPEFFENTSKPTPPAEPKKVAPVVISTPESVATPKVEVIETSKKEPSIAEQLQTMLEKYYQPTTSDSLNETDWQFIRQAILAGETGSLNQQDVEMFTDLSLGKLDFFKRNFRTAIETYRKAVTTNSNSPFPQIELANAYYQNGDFRTAVSYYKSALEINPNLWHAQVKYARSLLKSGDTTTAAQVLGKVSQSEFKSAEITTLTAETYLANRQYDKAISILFADTSENPKLENCLILAEAFEKTLIPQNAIRFLRMADELSPNNPRILLKLGELFIPTDKVQALSLINKAIELDKIGAYINLNEAQKLAKRAR